MTFLCSLNFGFLADGEFASAAWRLAQTGIVSLVCAVIGAAITIAVLRNRIFTLEKTTDDHGRKIETLSRDVAKLYTDRTGCELRASQTFATRGETARIMVETSQQYETIRSTIDGGLSKVHERINNLCGSVAALEERTGK